MSITQVYPFTTASNYTLSNTVISGGQALLDTENNSNQSFNQDFSSISGFTFNSDDTEFNSSTMQQKSQNPTGSVVGATYTTDTNATFNVAGSLTGTLIGSPNITGGKLACSGAQGVKYVMSSRNDGNGAMRVKYTPAYTSTPASNLDIIGINPDNGTNNGKMELRHDTTGQLKVTVYNSAGGIVYFATAFSGTWNPTSGTEYELELNWDYSTGDIRLFIDGSLFGLINSEGAWTHTGAADVTLFVGANTRALNNANGSFDNPVFFDSVKHVGGYVAGYTLPENLYMADTVTLPSFSYSGVGEIQSLDSFSVNETGSVKYIIDGKYWDGAAWSTSNGDSDSNSSSEVNANISSLSLSNTSSVPVKVVFADGNTQQDVSDLTIGYTGEKYSTSGYVEPSQAINIQSASAYSHSITTTGNSSLGVVLKVDGSLKYWDGAAWSASDGTSQVNTESEVNTNISSLSLSTNSQVFVRWVFSSSADTETSSIDTASISYDFGGIETDAETCIIHGYYKDIRNQGISGATIKFSLKSKSAIYKEAAGNIIDAGPVSVTTDSNGYFEIDLIRTSEYESAMVYKIEIEYNGKTIDKKNGSDIIFSAPDETTKDITSLLN